MFNKKEPGLENKTCFSITGLDGNGHGGGSRNEFVFALLDWTNEPSGRIRRWYLALNGDPSVRLTQQRLDAFKMEGGRFANLRVEAENNII